MSQWLHRQRRHECETKPHPYNNDDFALLQADGHRRGSCVLRRLISGYNLQQLHLVHWREVVHSDHLRTQQITFSNAGFCS